MTRFLMALFFLGTTAAFSDEPRTGHIGSKSPVPGFGAGRVFDEAPPLDDETWMVKECLSDGTCKYYNRKTGEIRLVKRKAEEAPAKKEAKNDPAVKPAGHVEKKKGDALSDEEKKLLADATVLDLADFKKRLPLAKKDGRKFLILQVGNLAGCPPCQQINKQLQESALAKDPTVGIYEFNYLTGGEKMKELLHQIELPKGFAFPYVYVFELDEKGEWVSRYSKLDRNGAMNLDNVKAAIDSFKKPAEPAKK